VNAEDSVISTENLDSRVLISVVSTVNSVIRSGTERKLYGSSAGRRQHDHDDGSIFVPRTQEAFTYDDDGNLTSDGRWNYTWDAENRLIRQISNTAADAPRYMEFEYDWQARRIGKKVWNNRTGTGAPAKTLKFVYDGWNLIAVLDGTFGLEQSFLWGLDLSGSEQGAGRVGGLVKMTSYDQATDCFVAYDGNGNVVGLVNAANGNVVARYEYGPFGEMIRSSGTMASFNPLRFSTKYQDEESGLLYYGYRYYNPSTGRWLSRDPIGERGGFDLNAYIDGDPVNAVDTLGEQKKVPWDDYWATWKALNQGGLTAAQLEWAEKNLARGCIGVVCLHLGEAPKPTDCYRTRAQAEARRQQLAKKCSCENGVEMYSIHLWNDTGKKSKKPDLVFEKSGKADLTNWNQSRKPGRRENVNFDFGWVYPNGTIHHADLYHNPDRNGDKKGDYYPDPLPNGTIVPINESTILYDDISEWQSGATGAQYQDFNAEVWCVQCKGGKYGKK
jgi:RHS repeat-associated protein